MPVPCLSVIPARAGTQAVKIIGLCPGKRSAPGDAAVDPREQTSVDRYSALRRAHPYGM